MAFALSMNTDLGAALGASAVERHDNDKSGFAVHGAPD